MQNVYVLSGPAGIGKSTTSRILVNATFPEDAHWLKDKLAEINVNVVYVVLWTDIETLLKRDQLRKKEHQMGERCLILIEEFKKSGLDSKHLLDTNKKSAEDLEQVIEEIMNNKQFKLD